MNDSSSNLRLRISRALSYAACSAALDTSSISPHLRSWFWCHERMKSSFIKSLTHPDNFLWSYVHLFFCGQIERLSIRAQYGVSARADIPVAHVAVRLAKYRMHAIQRTRHFLFAAFADNHKYSQD